MMKNSLWCMWIGLILVLVATSCAIINSSKNIKKSLFDATAQRGNAGRAEGNRWVTFQIKLVKAPKNVVADSMWVNDFALAVEQTQVGDTTYFTSLYYGMSPGQKEPLVADANYSGWVRIYYSEKVTKLKVPIFRVVEPLYYP